MKKLVLGIGVVVWTATGCSTSSGLTPLSDGHITAQPKAAELTIPPLARAIPILAKPIASPKLETYSVVVSQLDVHDLLFALARDARINVDVSPGVSGVVTLNAINQTLPQILDRIARQVDLRWTMENGVLNIRTDEPYVQTYKVDYLNLARSMKSNVSISNSVAATGGSVGTTQSGGGSAAGCGSGGSNASCTLIDYTSENQFWIRLEKNLKEMLGLSASATSTAAVGGLSTIGQATGERMAAQQQTTAGSERKSSTNDKEIENTRVADEQKNQTLQQGRARRSDIEAIQERAELQLQMRRIERDEYKQTNSVVINPESGLVLIRANHKDQKKVAELLAQMQSAVQRQVLIEATIVEVVLSNQYQAGVDWSQIANGAGWSFGQSLIGTNLASAPLSLISYKSGNFNATVQMLEQFGKTRVLSSPKIIALNNQTAVMKVVEEQVYFTIKVTPGTAGSIGTPATAATYESELHTVPVGLVMQVTPQISESGTISMNVRPTITNISSYVDDPAVAIVAATTNAAVKSMIPVLQVREFDSTLRIASGQVAVLGGLIQDKQENQRQGVPGLSRIPWLGDAFSYRDDKVKKIELVVFLRPMVVKENGQDDRLGGLKSSLPGDDFFNPSRDQDLSAFQSGLIPLPSPTGGRQ